MLLRFISLSVRTFEERGVAALRDTSCNPSRTERVLPESGECILLAGYLVSWTISLILCTSWKKLNLLLLGCYSTALILNIYAETNRHIAAEKRNSIFGGSLTITPCLDVFGHRDMESQLKTNRRRA